MPRVRTAIIATLLAVGAVTIAGTTAAVAMEPNQEAICGAWQWTGGTSFQRLCIDGNLYWYEYR